MQAFRLWAVFLIPIFLTVAHASEPCKCNFDNSKYSAFGTRAACTAITRGGKTCEVRFGATDFKQKLVNQVIPGVNYKSFRDRGFELTSQYLDALRYNKLADLNDRKFLSEAIPFFLRSAYLSTSEPLLSIRELKALDQRIVEYFKNNTSKAQQIFANKRDSIKEEVDGTTFEIRRGYIVVTSGDLLIVSVFFPETD